MKRSEMIDIIIKSSKDYNPTSSINFMQADCILQAIEKHGMITPERWREKNYGTGQELTYSQWLQLPSKIREWDKE